MPFGFGTTLTAVNLERLDGLLGETRDLGHRLYLVVKKPEYRFRLLDLRRQVLSYLSSDNLDLPELLRGIAGLDLGDRDIPILAGELRKTLEASRVAHWAGGRVYGKAGGISVTVSDFMSDYDRRKYALLRWSTFSRWNRLLDRLAER